MCTLLTIDAKFWQKNRLAVRTRILDDARWNSDGFALLAIDPEDRESDVKLNTMSIMPILSMLESFFKYASPDARIWLHSRMATTDHVGIGFTHGFDDREGRVTMHNGVIWNPEKLMVDSFSLAYAPSHEADLYDWLVERGDSYANIFTIDTVSLGWSLVRLSVGSLFMDGEGNYATNPVGLINVKVPEYCHARHVMPCESEYPVDEEESFAEENDEAYADDSEDEIYTDEDGYTRLRKKSAVSQPEHEKSARVSRPYVNDVDDGSWMDDITEHEQLDAIERDLDKAGYYDEELSDEEREEIRQEVEAMYADEYASRKEREQYLDGDGWEANAYLKKTYGWD